MKNFVFKFAFLSFLLMCFCGCVSVNISGFYDRKVDYKAYNKVIIDAKFDNIGEKKKVEMHTARALKQLGIEAFASSQAISQLKTFTREELQKELLKSGVNLLVEIDVKSSKERSDTAVYGGVGLMGFFASTSRIKNLTLGILAIDTKNGNVVYKGSAVVETEDTDEFAENLGEEIAKEFEKLRENR